ncbi:MAG: nucleotidyltransferase, partial [Balneolaceae bacterium]
MEALSKDFKEFIILLNKQKIEYLLVGGYAVILYGSPRYTGDIDFWVKPERNNIEKLLDALNQFGFSSLNIQVDDLNKPDQVLQLGYPPLRIDILTSISGLDFDNCLPNSQTFDIEGLKIKVIGLEDLKKN